MSTPTIKIAVSQADATLVQATTLTSGMQNLPVVKFYFTDEWAGLGKTAVFIAGSVALEVLVVNNQAVVPAECLETAGVNLTVGIYGANTQIVLPTVYCSCGEILTGTDVGDASNVGEPTTELVDQMLAYAAEIEAVADTLDNLAIRTVHVNTDGANHYGIASVTLSDTGSGEDRTLTFAFSNLKGNGIESITWSEAGEYRGRIQITESNGTVTNFDALIEAINYLENLINRAEAWAVGTIDGVPVEDIDPDDPAYQNNAKYYAEMAEDAGTGAEAAQEAAETAQGKAEDAQEAAEAAQAAAESAEATATAAASSASGDAGSAAGSASSAASSASDAAASELSAANSRDQALAAAANTHDDAASASASATSASNSATAASNSSQQSSVHRFMSEAWAVGTMNGNPVSSSAIQYNNHSKYYAGNASADALKAEGNAVGKQNGTDVGSSSPYYHNNAKYYNDQAASSATAAETAQGKAEDAQEAAETAAATFTTDTTLSVSGKAADAKATGDAIATHAKYNMLIPNYWTDWSGVNNNVTVTKAKNMFSFSGTHNSAYRYVVFTANEMYSSNGNERKTISEDAFTLGKVMKVGHWYKFTVEVVSAATGGKYYDYCRVVKYIDSATDAESMTADLAATNTQGTVTSDCIYYQGEKLALVIRLKSGDMSGLVLRVNMEELYTLDLDETILKPIYDPSLDSDRAITITRPIDKMYLITGMIPLPPSVTKFANNAYAYGNYVAVVYYDENKSPIGSNANRTEWTIDSITSGSKYFRLGNFDAPSGFQFRCSFGMNESDVGSYLAKLINLEPDYQKINLLDGAVWREHTYIERTAGTDVYDVSSDYASTDFIELPDDVYGVIGEYNYTEDSNYARIAFYDEDKEYISSEYGVVARLAPREVPDGTAYIKLSTLTTSVAISDSLCVCLIPVNKTNSADAVIDIIRAALVDD